ncbi:MAG: hypothetical protein U0792_05880 [Gemmataceae bacterium]
MREHAGHRGAGVEPQRILKVAIEPVAADAADRSREIGPVATGPGEPSSFPFQTWHEAQAYPWNPTSREP